MALLRRCLRFRSIMRPYSDVQPATSGESENAMDFGQFMDNIDSQTHEEDIPFPRLLRESKFMQLGSFNGRLLIGKVTRRVAGDLYIDMGLKFNAVCRLPSVNSESYLEGSRVLVRLHDVELSERFLGSRKDLTLLEADATLLRLIGSGNRPKPAKPITKAKTDDKQEEKIEDK